MLSRRTPEYAVRRMVSAISSAIESSVLRKSSNAMGSRGACMSDLLSQLDGDVAVGVERSVGARRDHTRRVVLLDDARTLARRGEVSPVDDRRLAPAELGTEVDAPRSAGAAGPGAVEAQRVRYPRPIRDAEADDAQADDLDGLVVTGLVSV